VGDMQAFLALLELELRTILRRPHARGYPPRIFIAYRRATPDDIAWCLSLANALTENGYEVLLDELVITGFDADAIARFMAQIADADIALLVPTEDYLRHEGSSRPSSRTGPVRWKRAWSEDSERAPPTSTCVTIRTVSSGS
jgi:TIR domain-containing protein